MINLAPPLIRPVPAVARQVAAVGKIFFARAGALPVAVPAGDRVVPRVFILTWAISAIFFPIFLAVVWPVAGGAAAAGGADAEPTSKPKVNSIFSKPYSAWKKALN